MKVKTLGWLEAVAFSFLSCIIRKENLGAFIGEGFNSEEFQPGGLHEKHTVAAWNLGNHLNICLKTGKPRKPLTGNIPDKY